MKNEELINRDHKESDGPGKQRWMDGEISRERSLPFLYMLLFGSFGCFSPSGPLQTKHYACVG